MVARADCKQTQPSATSTARVQRPHERASSAAHWPQQVNLTLPSAMSHRIALEASIQRALDHALAHRASDPESAALVKKFVERGWLRAPPPTAIARVPSETQGASELALDDSPYQAPIGSVQDVLERRGRLKDGVTLYYLPEHSRHRRCWSRPASAAERRVLAARPNAREVKNLQNAPAAASWTRTRSDRARQAAPGAVIVPRGLFRRPPGGWTDGFDLQKRIPRHSHVPSKGTVSSEWLMGCGCTVPGPGPAPVPVIPRRSRNR